MLTEDIALTENVIGLHKHSVGICNNRMQLYMNVIFRRQGFSIRDVLYSSAACVTGCSCLLAADALMYDVSLLVMGYGEPTKSSINHCHYQVTKMRECSSFPCHD